MDVNWRMFLAFLWLVLAAGANGYLLNKEEIAGVEKTAKQLVRAEDPLLDLRHVAADRLENFKKMGLDPAVAEATVRKVKDLEQLYAPRLEALLNEAADPDALADALCGETRDVRPRYGALRFLISEDNGRRDVIRLNRISGLEAQDWYLTSPVDAVYQEIELLAERQPDATVMALAAILLKREQDVLEHNTPWGQGIALQWSWARVKAENSGIQETLVSYLALMHLTVELAQKEGGICDA